MYSLQYAIKDEAQRESSKSQIRKHDSCALVVEVQVSKYKI